MPKIIPSDDALLDRLQSTAFDYFLRCVNPDNGLIADTSREGAPSSIAGVGFALSAYAVAVERGWMTRGAAVQRTLATLRFFNDGPAEGGFAAIGAHGFCYHFLDMATGRRAWNCELSFIDTALLVAGMLAAASYFAEDSADEAEIRALADQFYRRIEWKWALNGGNTLALAWTPEKGFMRQRWKGYNEGLILYILGLASPTFPLLPADYAAWGACYNWREIYGMDVLYGAPLFVHHFSHAWVDFRGIRDGFMRGRDQDYFENSRRAALVHQRYAIENPRGFAGYGENCWGLSAGDGPAGRRFNIGGKQYRARGYAARGAPDGPDDGTLMPSALVSCLPFLPAETLQALHHIRHAYPDVLQDDRMPSGFNPSLKDQDGAYWISSGYYALDQGIMIMMIENHRTGFFWTLMRRNPVIRDGLHAAGFTGGWLDARTKEKS